MAIGAFFAGPSGRKTTQNRGGRLSNTVYRRDKAARRGAAARRGGLHCAAAKSTCFCTGRPKMYEL